MKKYIIIPIAVIVLLVTFFVVIPAVVSNQLGAGMSVQHYDENGEPVGVPLTYGWVGPDSDPVVTVTVVISWMLQMTGIDENTITVTGSIEVEIVEVGMFDTETFTSGAVTDSKAYTWTLADMLYVGEDFDVCFIGTLNAYGYDDAGVRVDATEWTSSLTISYVWDVASLTIEGSIGT